MTPDEIAALKALTDATRLRIAGRLAAGPATLDEIVAGLGLRRADAVRHLRLLQDHGLASGGAGAPFTLRLDALIALGRTLDAAEREAEHLAASSFEAPPGTSVDDAKVLRAFVVDGRLASIPASEKKRAVILRFLRDTCFADDRDYPEKEVNQRLGLFHPDVASLRRYLVDTKLMTRDRGVYRRADG
jgi:hypothetical protein